MIRFYHVVLNWILRDEVRGRRVWSGLGRVL